MLSNYLSVEQVKLFHEDGYIIIKNFCGKKEVEKLLLTAIRDKEKLKNPLDMSGQKFRQITIDQWFTPGNDVFGYLERSEKVVDSIAGLLDSNMPVCHIHSKVMERECVPGGKWEWHQDYAYWYTNKFKNADQMASVVVALTPFTTENGCSRIIKGSHKLGRLKHNFEGEYLGADMEVVENALKTLEIVTPELEAGDALFFHSNLLHRSEANLSGSSCWYNVSCYSSQGNISKQAVFTSWYTPVVVLPNESILNGDTIIAGDEVHLNAAAINILNKRSWNQHEVIS